MKDFLAEKRDLLKAVKSDGMALRNARAEFRAHRKVVLQAVKSNGRALQFADHALQADKRVVLKAVKNNGLALEFASTILRADTAVVLKALKSNGCSLQFASLKLRAEGEVVWRAVKKDGLALKYASVGLRSREDICLKAVKKDGRALQFVENEALRAERRIILKVVKMEGGMFRYASENLRGDRRMTVAAVKSDGGALLYTECSALLADKDFVLLAARSCRHAGDIQKCYHKADQSVRAAIPWNSFLGAVTAAIAVQGQAAPILSVVLSRTSCGAREDSESRTLHPNEVDNGDENGRNQLFCEATMMSGRSFTCHLPGQSEIGPMTAQRAGPIVDDLANVLVAEMSKHTEAHPASVFIVFTPVNDTDDPISVTAWDWDRPLINLVRS